MKNSSWEEAVAWLARQPDQQALVRASYLDQPLSAAAKRYWESQEWKTVAALLPTRKGEALDFGAGNGIVSYALAREDWHVTAIEPERSNLVGAGAIRKLAEEENLRIQIVQGYGEVLPFENEIFDVIIARQVLHHARDLGKMCREINRVLRCGGILVAARDHVISNRSHLESFLKKHPLHKVFDGENAFLLWEYKNALKEGGFVIDRVLRPFDSVINYAPLTHDSLRKEFCRHVCKFMGKRLASFLAYSRIFEYELDLLSIFDRRPGRLYTFICHRPQG